MNDVKVIRLLAYNGREFVGASKLWLLPDETVDDALHSLRMDDRIQSVVRRHPNATSIWYRLETWHGDVVQEEQFFTGANLRTRMHGNMTIAEVDPGDVWEGIRRLARARRDEPNGNLRDMLLRLRVIEAAKAYAVLLEGYEVNGYRLEKVE